MHRTFRAVIALWKTRADMARSLDLPELTVTGWWQRDSIPSAHFVRVVSAAAQDDIPGITNDLLAQIAFLRGPKTASPHPRGVGATIPANLVQRKAIQP